MFFPPGSSMEEFFVLDSENCGLAGKMNGEKLVKKPSLGSAVRKRLSDITNSQHLPNSPIQDEKSKLISASTKDYIEQLHKENTALVRLLADRNKIIELTGVELTKMRINLQKVQEQNWHLAQANNKMLMELNLGKDRLKALTHELGCKVALLSAKNSELEETVNTRPCQRAHTEEVLKKCEETKGTSNHSRRHQSRVQGQSAVAEKLGVKDKADDKRQSAPVKCEQPESTEEKADNKRLCLRRQSARFKPEQQEEHTDEKAVNKRLQSRRQSARFKSEQPVKQEEHTDERADNKRPQSRRQSTRFKSEQPEPTEDLFEIEDAKFTVQPILDEPMQEDDPTNTTSSIKEEIKGKGDTPVSQRSSIGRPTRKAAEKVQSYKERPVNIKLRRPE